MTDKDNTIDPTVKLAIVRYQSFSADDKRAFQEGILNPPQEEIQTVASWADIRKVLGPITWAWKPWLADGMLHIVASESGKGKSALCLRVAACFTSGWDWPDKSPFKGDTGKVLWCETEAAQAVNLERAKAWGIPDESILTPLGDPLEDVKLDKPEHLNSVFVMAMRPDVKLVIIDSLRGSHRKDENSSESIELVMRLASLARDSGKPVLLTHHLRKRSLFDGDTIDPDRLRGSSAIVQAARLVWALDVPDQNTKEWARLQVIKSNLAKFPEPAGVTIDGDGVHFGLAPEAPRIESVADKAADLLLSLLRAEPMSSGELQAEIEGAGMSWISAKRAKKKLGIVSIKKEDGKWYWSLPSKREEDEYKDYVN